jgi:ParB family chromosome partitioning protein
MESVISVNPFRCRMWAHHDRLEGAANEQTCKTEIESFLKHGQLVPVLGRKLPRDSDYDLELIYGARRLFVAQHLNKPINVEVKDLDDMQAIIAMDIENRQRQNISPYEQGLCYSRWLRAKLFVNQDEIARTLKISNSQISRLLRLARLPAVVVGAFHDPVEICERWGLDLMEAWEDPNRRSTVAQRARAFSVTQPRPPSREVYRQLLASHAGRTGMKRGSHDEVVKDPNGMPLFRIRQQNRMVALLLPVERIRGDVLDEIRRALIDVLCRANAQSVDTTSVTAIRTADSGRSRRELQSKKRSYEAETALSPTGA